jgi:carboxypeptidase family protein
VTGATIAIQDGPNATRSTTSNTTGTYTLANLQVSGFTVAVAADGYVTQMQGVTLTSNQTVNFALIRAGLRTEFGAGQWLVGTDIAAGRYYSDPVSGCYWERQSGLGGTLGDVLANEFVSFDAGQIIVDVLSGDKAFQTDAECRTWYYTPRAAPPAGSITPGTWLVNTQIQAGSYRANVSAGCYWERLRHFQGTLGGIISNGFISTAGQAVVGVGATDVGFNSDGECNTWTRIGAVTGSPPVATPVEIEHARGRNRAARP